MKLDVTMKRLRLSDELYKSLSIKERIQIMDDLDHIHLTQEQIKNHSNKWKDFALLNDQTFKERLEIEGLDEELFSKVLEVSKNEEWTHKYKFSENQRPSWMNEIDEAFWINRAEPLPKYDQVDLSVAFRPFILWARNKLNQFYQENPSLAQKVIWEELLESIIHNLAHGLASIGARTIVLELHIAKQLNELTGDTPEERYESFIRTKLINPDCLEFIYKEYPVLARVLMSRTSYFVNAMTEALSRYINDYEQIRDCFIIEKPPLLKSVSAGLGDSHQQGRSVIKFQFASNQEVLYKPKSLSVAVHFHQLLEWINKKGFRPELKGYKIIDRHCYSWEELVKHEDCKKEEQIQNYYKRLGGYLAVLYVLNGADFHHENIIANGEFPKLIDLETIFHHVPEIKIEETAEVKAKLMVVNSVLGTGLLPHLFFRSADGRGVDISGISTKAQELPIPILQVENEGTDEMRFVRKKAILKTNYYNAPKLNGKIVGAADYIDFIIEGFKNAGRIILNNKEELISETGPLSKFKDVEIRIIIRPTQYYGNFILESQHPDYMRDWIERDKLLDRLWFTVLDTRQIPFEKRDLLNGDIPIFTTKPGSRDLITSSGERIPNFFKKASYDISVERIAGLTMGNIEQQARWIEASIASNCKEKISIKQYHFSPEDLNNVDTNLFVEEAKKIGYRLAEQAIIGNRNDAAWIGLVTNYYGQWQVSALDQSLYNGLSGIALFLAYLGKVTNEKDFTKLALQAVETIIHSPIHSKSFCSAFYGQASTLYTLAHFITLYGKQKTWDSYLNRVLTNIERNVRSDNFYDLLGGSAGIIHILLNISEQFESEYALHIAQMYGDHLLKNKVMTDKGVGWRDQVSQNLLGGFSHGTSGIAWSLLRLHKLTSKQDYYETALEAIRYDRSLYDPNENNWLDLRCSEHKDSDFAAAWCHGAAGIGLSRVLYLAYLNEQLLLQEIETAVSTTLMSGMGRSHCLCHGDLGNAELFYMAGSMLGRTEWVRMAEAIGMNVIQERKQNGKYNTGVPRQIEIPGLFLGISGIGYQLLRLSHPQQVPSVLTLEKPIESK